MRSEWIVRYQSPGRPEGGELIAGGPTHAEECRRAVILSGWTLNGETEVRPIHANDTIPCPECDGLGGAECDTCDGNGVVAADWFDPDPSDDELTRRAT